MANGMHSLLQLGDVDAIWQSSFAQAIMQRIYPMSLFGWPPWFAFFTFAWPWARGKPKAGSDPLPFIRRPCSRLWSSLSFGTAPSN
eukprot:6488498-Amphidinium_carterae.5